MASHLQHTNAEPTELATTEHPRPDPTWTDISPSEAAEGFRRWGWPVMVRNGQLWLALDTVAVAVLVPTALTDELTALLTRRHSRPPVLHHPDSPDHRVLLAGEPYGLPFPWPARVQRIRGSVLLPPTVTPHGVLTWMHRPGPDSLRLCREIDVVAALRALHDPPSGAGPAHF